MWKNPARAENIRKTVFLAALAVLLVVAGLLRAAQPASSQSGLAFRLRSEGSSPEDSGDLATIDPLQVSPTATPIPPAATSTPEPYPPVTPTPEPYPPATPVVPTPTPTTSMASPTPISTPCPGPRVLGIAWEDVNDNGWYDKDDLPLGGVTITLMDYATRQIVRTTITGADGQYDFDNLSAKVYLLQAKAPPGYQAITPQAWGIDLVCSTVKVDFGYKPEA